MDALLLAAVLRRFFTEGTYAGVVEDDYAGGWRASIDCDVAISLAEKEAIDRVVEASA